jgi:hypothetical protein
MSGASAGTGTIGTGFGWDWAVLVLAAPAVPTSSGDSGLNIWVALVMAHPQHVGQGICDL